MAEQETSFEQKANQEKRVTMRDIKTLFIRLHAMQFSWNYEKMQNLGFLYIMLPLLKKLYKDNPEELKMAVKRHLEFFNTTPAFAAPIVGITAALEEASGNQAGKAITSLKSGLMGPLAGIGDSVLWFTMVPIAYSIGASFTAQGNPLGLLIALFLFNIVAIPLKWQGIKQGYLRGANILKDTKNAGIVQKITTMATVLGLTVVGGLIPQMVNIQLALKFQLGEVAVEMQKIIDGIIPGMLSVLLTLILYKGLKKGKSPVMMILSIIVLCIVGKYFSIL